MPRFLLPLLLVLSALQSRAATIVIGPERTVPLSYAPGVRSPNGHARIASDGESFLMAWSSWSYSGAKGHGSILTSSLDSEGNIRSTAALPYETDADVFSVTWTGEAYRILWRDTNDGGIAFADVDRDGNVIRPRTMVVPPDQSTLILAAATNRDRILIIYYASSGRQMRLIAADGTIARNDLIVPTDADKLAVTADDHGFAFFWTAAVSSTRSLFGQRFTRDGDADSAAVHIADLRFVVSISAASNNGYDVVVVNDAATSPSAPAGTTYSIRRFVLDPSWRVSELSPIVPAPPESPTAVNVIADGTRFFASWMAGNTRLNFHTAHFGPGDAGVVEDRITEFAISFASGRHLLGLESVTEEGFLLDRNPPGARIETFPVTRHLAPQLARGVASIGEQSLIVWTEDNVVRALRVDRNGETIDAEPLIVGYTAAPPAFDIPTVNVVVAGSRYWITWWTGFGGVRQVMLRAVSTTGEMSDPITTPLHDPLVGAGTSGSTILLVSAGGLSSARFSSTGQLLGTSFTLGDVAAYAPSIAWDGQEFLVVWQKPVQECTRFCITPYTKSQLRAARVTEDGVVLDSIALTPFETFGNLASGTAASDGRDFLVAFNETQTAKARRVTADGAVSETHDLEPRADVTAVQAWPGGYLVFTSDFAKSQAGIVRTDANGNLVEHADTLDWVVTATSRRADGTLIAISSRRSEIRELAGNEQLFIRTVSPMPSRSRAVSH